LSKVPAGAGESGQALGSGVFDRTILATVAFGGEESGNRTRPASDRKSVFMDTRPWAGPAAIGIKALLARLETISPPGSIRYWPAAAVQRARTEPLRSVRWRQRGSGLAMPRGGRDGQPPIAAVGRHRRGAPKSGCPMATEGEGSAGCADQQPTGRCSIQAAREPMEQLQATPRRKPSGWAMPEGLNRDKAHPRLRRGGPGRKGGRSQPGLQVRLSPGFRPLAARGCLALGRWRNSLLLKRFWTKEGHCALEQAASGGRALGPGERHQNGVNTSALDWPLIKPRTRGCFQLLGNPFKSLDGSHHHQQVTLAEHIGTRVDSRQIVHRPGCQEVHFVVLAQFRSRKGLADENDWGPLISSMLLRSSGGERSSRRWGAIQLATSSSPASSERKHTLSAPTAGAAFFVEGSGGWPGDHCLSPGLPSLSFGRSKWPVDCWLRSVH